jgi:hypothetical protein
MVEAWGRDQDLDYLCRHSIGGGGRLLFRRAGHTSHRTTPFYAEQIRLVAGCVAVLALASSHQQRASARLTSGLCWVGPVLLPVPSARM